MRIERLIRDMRLILVITLLLTAGFVQAASPFDGRWAINYEETDKVAVRYKDGSGMGGNNFKPQITIMGMPLPGQSRPRGNSALAAKSPKVLRCTTMEIAVDGDRVDMDYDAEGKETLRKGHYRGRDTRMSKREIRQKYETHERKVTKTWTMRSDGRLFVSVKINPKGDKSRTYNRVFDRVVEEAEADETPPAS